MRDEGLNLRTTAATVAAMVAFAFNSILCRLALGPGVIDPVSFTGIRLTSGAAALLVIALSTGRGGDRGAGSWRSGVMLFAYAISFSYAYVTLNAGTGALILFGAVQLTMIATAIVTGERPRVSQWLGLFAALGGFIYLVSPGLEAPSPVGAILMTVAGVSWGVYTLRGRGNRDPISATTDNFVRATPLVWILGLATLRTAHVSWEGALLAITSGALTSGVGYVIWYAALRGLSATRAATVQLTVPLIAAAGGAVFLAESITLRLAIAAVLILGGVALVMSVRERRR